MSTIFKYFYSEKFRPCKCGSSSSKDPRLIKESYITLFLYFFFSHRKQAHIVQKRSVAMIMEPFILRCTSFCVYVIAVDYILRGTKGLAWNLVEDGVKWQDGLYLLARSHTSTCAVKTTWKLLWKTSDVLAEKECVNNMSWLLATRTLCLSQHAPTENMTTAMTYNENDDSSH